MSVRTLDRRTLLRGLAIGAGGVGVGAALGACSSGGGASSGQARPVGYQLSWTHSVQFGGSYVAARDGFWSDQDLDVTLSPGGPNVAGDAQVISGAVLMNITSADQVARANAEGGDLRIVGQQYQINPSTLLSLAENPIEEPTQLIGARIGVAGTDVPALEAFCLLQGIPYDEIELVPSQYDPAALTAGQVDALWCFATDLPVALEVQGVEGVSMLLGEFGYNVAAQTYAVRAATLEDEALRGDVVKLLRGDIQGWQAYQEDPAAAAALTLEQYPDGGLDLPTQEAQAQVQLGLMFSDLTEQNGFAWFADESIAQNIEWMGLIDVEGLPEYWDRSILEEIYADGPVA